MNVSNRSAENAVIYHFAKKTGIIKFRFANVIAFCNNKVLLQGIDPAENLDG